MTLTLEPRPATDPLAALREAASLRADTAELLYRLLRDPRRAVWEAACEEAGRRAVRESTAYEMVAELLDGPMRELRLRGVVALAAMAQGRPEVVSDFFRTGLEDADYATDPVLTDALCMLPAHLPIEVGEPLLAQALHDSREAVRAAAAAALPHMERIPSGVLVELALDDSSLVRCSLAFSVCGMLGIEEAAQAVGMLAEAGEDFIREYLARELPRIDATKPVLARLAADSSERVREAAAAKGSPPAVEAAPRLTSDEQPVDAFARVSAIEQRLDERPEATFEVLRPLLDSDQGVALLEPLSHLSRNPDVAALCRGLRQLLEAGRSRAEDRLLTVYEMLGNPQHAAAAAFKWFIAYAVDALRVRRPAQAVQWAARVRAETAQLEASGWLEALGQLCVLAEAMDGYVGTLSDALLQLEQSAARIRTDFLLPERMILLLVVERWSDMLDQEIQDQVAGVTS